MKIDKTRLEEFRKTLPEDIQNEIFRWLTSHYDIPTALFIIKEQGLPINEMNVKQWATAFGMSGEYNENAIFMLTGVSDKEAMQDKIDPKYPLIVIEHTYKFKRKTEVTTLIIDGNKRLRKSFLTGMEKIPAYFLNKELAKLCLVK